MAGEVEGDDLVIALERLDRLPPEARLVVRAMHEHDGGAACEGDGRCLAPHGQTLHRYEYDRVRPVGWIDTWDTEPDSGADIEACGVTLRRRALVRVVLTISNQGSLARFQQELQTLGQHFGRIQQLQQRIQVALTTVERDALIKATAAGDGMGVVKQSLPQDPGQAGKGQAQALAAMLAGHQVHTSPETGDKVVRARPFASQVNAGNVLMLRAAWNRDFVEELRTFPNGVNDDQVDGASRAFAQLIGAAVGVFA